MVKVIIIFNFYLFCNLCFSQTKQKIIEKFETDVLQTYSRNSNLLRSVNVNDNDYKRVVLSSDTVINKFYNFKEKEKEKIMSNVGVAYYLLQLQKIIATKDNKSQCIEAEKLLQNAESSYDLIMYANYDTEKKEYRNKKSRTLCEKKYGRYYGENGVTGILKKNQVTTDLGLGMPEDKNTFDYFKRKILEICTPTQTQTYNTSIDTANKSIKDSLLVENHLIDIRHKSNTKDIKNMLEMLKDSLSNNTLSNLEDLMRNIDSIMLNDTILQKEYKDSFLELSELYINKSNAPFYIVVDSHDLQEYIRQDFFGSVIKKRLFVIIPNGEHFRLSQIIRNYPNDLILTKYDYYKQLLEINRDQFINYPPKDENTFIALKKDAVLIVPNIESFGFKKYNRKSYTKDGIKYYFMDDDKKIILNEIR